MSAKPKRKQRRPVRRNRLSPEVRTNVLKMISQSACRLPSLSGDQYADVLERFALPPEQISEAAQSVLQVANAALTEPIPDMPGQNELVRDTLLYWCLAHQATRDQLLRAAVDWERLVLYGRANQRQAIIEQIERGTNPLRIDTSLVRRGLLAGLKGNRGFGAADFARFIRECGTPGHRHYLGDAAQRFLLARASDLIV